MNSAQLSMELVFRHDGEGCWSWRNVFGKTSVECDMYRLSICFLFMYTFLFLRYSGENMHLMNCVTINIWWSTLAIASMLGCWICNNNLMLTVSLIWQLPDSINGFTVHLEFCACFIGCICLAEKEGPAQPCAG